MSHKLNKKLWVCGRSVGWNNKDRSEIKSVVGDGTKNVLYMYKGIVKRTKLVRKTGRQYLLGMEFM